MAFQVSPGVQVTEKDLTNVVPAVATSIAGIVMAAQKGPTDTITAIASEDELVQIFGEPQSASNQFEDWMAAAAFLGYGNALRVVRPASAAVNACVSGTALLIKNTAHYNDGDGSTGPYKVTSTGPASVGQWAARTAGAWGNSLKVAMCPSATEFEQTFSGAAGVLGVTTGTPSVGSTQLGVDPGGGSAGDGGDVYNVGDIVYFQEADGSEYKVTAITADALTIERYGTANTAGGLRSALATATNVRRRWEYYDQFDGAPGTSTHVQDRTGVATADEMHIIVIDEDGAISGVPKEILEKWTGLSKISDARSAQGAANFYVDAIYTGSSYIYVMDHPGVSTGYGNTALAQGTTLFSAQSEVITSNSLISGVDDYALTAGEQKDGIDRFKDTETVDLNLFLCGKADATKAGNAMDMCTDRKDAVAFVSPELSDVVNVANEVTQTSNVKGYFDALTSTSYAMFDSGYKYTYDKYNDSYRWIPLNGDIAGLCARTDLVADAWWSPGGFNRGQVRGVVKLAYNPQKANRDILYRARINPVCAFPGQGTILYGDKTAQAKPSAFDRINVRRLFIVLEKAISTASKFQLFEFNDEFTRAGFRNMVEPFMRDIQGRRGVTDFLVVCDESNNPGSVVDRNEFVADIFVKPARSINFISLNFIATKTGVAFSEVVGA
jgi:phage tail sheath protein FI